ncbi:MAG: hypothetical protein KIH69_005455, partial [Anaerolineae bacterium]|nr:hypothetical protein [Anaerolineae bacterium]
GGTSSQSDCASANCANLQKISAGEFICAHSVYLLLSLSQFLKQLIKVVLTLYAYGYLQPSHA